MVIRNDEVLFQVKLCIWTWLKQLCASCEKEGRQKKTGRKNELMFVSYFFKNVNEIKWPYESLVWMCV